MLILVLGTSPLVSADGFLFWNISTLIFIFLTKLVDFIIIKSHISGSRNTWVLWTYQVRFGPFGFICSLGGGTVSCCLSGVHKKLPRVIIWEASSMA